MPVKLRVGIALAAACAVLLVAFIWIGSRFSEQQRRIATLESELARARSRATQPVPAPAAVVPEARLAPSPAPSKIPEKPLAGPVNSAEVQELGARLSESNAAIARMQARVSELETQVLNLSADRSRLSSTGAAAQDRADDLDRKLQAAAGDKSAREKRIRDLEAEVARLRTQSSADDQKGAEIAGITRELRELSQRQQVYLGNIMRRYREVTELLRTLPSPGDPARENGGSGPELARIQTAISMADEDLRQLTDLNVRLSRMQKQIAQIASVSP